MFKAFSAAAVIVAVVSGNALAQPAAYPARPIKIVVPFPAGGPTDSYARLLAKGMQDNLGQPVVVENAAGATGLIGTEKVRNALPDGYTLLYTSSSAHVIANLLKPKPSFEAVKDFSLISMVLDYPVVLFAHPSIAVKSSAELVALAKAKPGSLTFSSVGTGSVGHLSCELYALANGIDIRHIPYKGSAPAQLAVVTGETNLMCDSIGFNHQMVQAGKLHAIGVLGKRRVPIAPSVPTVTEGGSPPVEANVWTGLLGPSGMPAEVVATLNGAVRKLVESAPFKERMALDGMDSAANSPKAFEQTIRSDEARWTAVVREKNIKGE